MIGSQTGFKSPHSCLYEAKWEFEELANFTFAISIGCQEYCGMQNNVGVHHSLCVLPKV